MPALNVNSARSRINAVTGAGRRIARNRNTRVGNQDRALRSASVFKNNMSKSAFARATGTGGH